MTVMVGYWDLIQDSFVLGCNAISLVIECKIDLQFEFITCEVCLCHQTKL